MFQDENEEIIQEDHIETYDIIVGNKEHQFTTKDTIFSLTGPIQKQVDSSTCNSCPKAFSSKKKQFCNFCGSRACENCMYKMRQYKSHLKSTNNTFQKGLICKVCENKFLLYENFNTFENNIKEQ